MHRQTERQTDRQIYDINTCYIRYGIVICMSRFSVSEDFVDFARKVHFIVTFFFFFLERAAVSNCSFVNLAVRLTLLGLSRESKY